MISDSGSEIGVYSESEIVSAIVGGERYTLYRCKKAKQKSKSELRGGVECGIYISCL